MFPNGRVEAPLLRQHPVRQMARPLAGPHAPKPSKYPPFATFTTPVQRAVDSVMAEPHGSTAQAPATSCAVPQQRTIQRRTARGIPTAVPARRRHRHWHTHRVSSPPAQRQKSIANTDRPHPRQPAPATPRHHGTPTPTGRRLPGRPTPVHAPHPTGPPPHLASPLSSPDQQSRTLIGEPETRPTCPLTSPSLVQPQHVVSTTTSNSQLGSTST